MKAGLSAIALLLLALSQSFAADGGAAQKKYHDEIVDAQLNTAETAARTGDFDFVIANLSASLDPAVYSLLSPKRQHEIMVLYGYASLRTGHWSDAHEAYQIASESPVGTTDDWKRRFLAARMTNESADVYASFNHLRSVSLDFFADLPLALVEDVDGQFAAMKDGGRARLEFGDTLDKAGWEPPDPFVNPSTVWLPYATALIESGQTEKATRVATRIVDPMTIIYMRADRRFDSITSAEGDRFDPAKAGEAWLAVMRKAVAKHPNSLEGQIALARALSHLNRNEEALQVLDTAMQELGVGMGNRQRRFTDSSGNIGNAQALRAEVLLALGKTDEGIATIKTILNAPWAKGLMFDLLVASRLNVFDRAEEALTYLSGPGDGDLSFGRPIARAEIKACVLAHLNRTKKLKGELDYLVAHRSEQPDHLIIAQLCANDLDGAATTLIATLRDPQQRVWALSELQVYSDKGIAPYTRVLRARRASLIARADVQAALAPVGRSQTYDLPWY